MSRVLFTGKGKLFWVADPTGAGTVVTLSAPTATQVNTGVNIVSMLTRTGLDIPQTGNTIDVSDAGSLFNKTDLGTFGGDKASVSCFRDTVTGTDIAWPLFAQGLRGFLIVFRAGTAGASPAAGDRCEVYQCAVASRTNKAISDSDPWQFTATLAITNVPNDNATLV